MRLVVKSNGVYTDKNGKERESKNFYLVTENGTYIAIKPSFPNCYNLLSAFAEKE